MLNFSLSPAQLKLQKKAREFALKEILPVAWYYDEIDETPLPVLKKAYEAGLINADIPKEYGGKGYGLIENVIITEEFSKNFLRHVPVWPHPYLTTPWVWNH
jgi:acyl-CoA dehydrogenase